MQSKQKNEQNSEKELRNGDADYADGRIGIVEPAVFMCCGQIAEQQAKEVCDDQREDCKLDSRGQASGHHLADIRACHL